jgi:hypothetical protein
VGRAGETNKSAVIRSLGSRAYVSVEQPNHDDSEWGGFREYLVGELLLFDGRMRVLPGPRPQSARPHPSLARLWRRTRPPIPKR